jgi:1-deoxy-D-xylulose-5-phosphate synthase
MRYPRGEGVGVPLPDELVSIPIGKAELLKDGTDVLLLPIGSMVYPAIEASEILEKDGISSAVVNPRFVKPLDIELLLPLIIRIGKVVTVEEHSLACGFGSAISEMINESGVSANIRHIGIPDHFVEHGDRKILLNRYGLTSQGIVNTVMEMLENDEKVLIEKQMAESIV